MKISRILGYLAMAFAFAVVAVPVYFIIITSVSYTHLRPTRQVR